MSRFADELTEQIFNTRFSAAVPGHVSEAAHRILQLLLAARSLGDVSVIGPILHWANLPDHLGVQVHEKWHILFVWDTDYGAGGLSLRRRS